MTEGVPPDAVYALAAAPGGIVFAARRSGLYRFENGGCTWEFAYAGEPGDALATTAVALSPAFAEDQTIFSGGHGAVLISTDRGRTWRGVSLPPPPPLVTALALSPAYAQDGVVLAGSAEDGVFRSVDRGSSWASWNFGLLDLRVLALALSPAFGDDETVFAATESGIFRSTNGGRAWRETGFPLDASPTLCLACTPTFDADHTLFAGSEASGLWRSTDAGQTWNQVALPLEEESINALLTCRIATQDALFCAVGAQVYCSLDGGSSWAPLLEEQSTYGAIVALAVTHDNTAPRLVIASATGAVFASDISRW
jgi:photosystem II stability/assembly factor-like uncharacterized protein